MGAKEESCLRAILLPLIPGGNKLGLREEGTVARHLGDSIRQCFDEGSRNIAGKSVEVQEQPANMILLSTQQETGNSRWRRKKEERRRYSRIKEQKKENSRALTQKGGSKTQQDPYRFLAVLNERERKGGRKAAEKEGQESSMGDKHKPGSVRLTHSKKSSMTISLAVPVRKTISQIDQRLSIPWKVFSSLSLSLSGMVRMLCRYSSWFLMCSRYFLLSFLLCSILMSDPSLRKLTWLSTWAQIDCLVVVPLTWIWDWAPQVAEPSLPPQDSAGRKSSRGSRSGTRWGDKKWGYPKSWSTKGRRKGPTFRRLSWNLFHSGSTRSWSSLGSIATCGKDWKEEEKKEKKREKLELKKRSDHGHEIMDMRLWTWDDGHEMMGGKTFDESVGPAMKNTALSPAPQFIPSLLLEFFSEPSTGNSAERIPSIH